MRLLTALLLMALPVACSGDGVPSGGGAQAIHKLVLTGSSTVAPLAAEIGKRFEKAHPGVRVDVQTGGSSRGITDVRNGLAHIGMTSRALKPSEDGLVAHTIARDGIGMIVHAENPVTKLTDLQIADIYRGRITRWNQVGGLDAPITVVNKAEGRSTLELFLGYFGLKNSEVRAHVVIGDNEHGVKTVAGNPNAIGYVSLGTAEYDQTHGIPIRALPMNGVPATTAEVAAGRFPISRPLNLLTAGPTEGWSATFIEFARSEAVADLVREQYFVPPG